MHKKKNDLTPYRIKESNHSYILSDQTTIVAEKRMKKFDNELKKDKNLQICFEWQNLTR